MNNIIFCGDSFSALDTTGNVEWNWMNTVARELDMNPIILGIVGCSNFVINLQVEHALENYDFNTIVVCLTATDRIEKQTHEDAGVCDIDAFKYAIDEVTDEFNPYKRRRTGYESYSLHKWMEKDDLKNAIPYLYAKGLNIKRNQIYVDNIMCMLEEKNFYIVRNIFPWWNSDEESSYERYMTNTNFLDTGPVKYFVEKGLHSSHLTKEASRGWSNELLNVIKNDPIFQYYESIKNADN